MFNNTINGVNLRTQILTNTDDEFLIIECSGECDSQNSLIFRIARINRDGITSESLTISSQLLGNAVGIINSFQKGVFLEVPHGKV